MEECPDILGYASNQFLSQLPYTREGIENQLSGKEPLRKDTVEYFSALTGKAIFPINPELDPTIIRNLERETLGEFERPLGWAPDFDTALLEIKLIDAFFD